jgi:hypothetical protein
MSNNRKTGRKIRPKAGSASGSRKQKRPSRGHIQTVSVLMDLLRMQPARKQVAPGTKLTLALSQDERKLILDDLMSCGLTDRQLRTLEMASKPELSMTLADWEDFGGWVAATGNHARDGSKLQRRADALSDRIQSLLDSYTDE